MTQKSQLLRIGAVILALATGAAVTLWGLSNMRGADSLAALAPADTAVLVSQVGVQNVPTDITELFALTPADIFVRQGQITLADGTQITALQTSSARSARSALAALALPDEPFTQQVYAHGDLWKPGFSSLYTYATSGAWLLVSPSEAALVTLLSDNEKLNANAEYVATQQDLPSRDVLRAWVSPEGVQSTAMSNFAVLAPVLRDLTQGAGLVVQGTEGNLRVRAKLLPIEGLLPVTPPARRTSAVPSLLRYAQWNQPLALTGVDIVQASTQLQEVLRDQFPDTAVLMTAALEAQKQQLLGDLSGWDTAWTKALRNEYMLLLDVVEDLPRAAFVVQLPSVETATAVRNFLVERARGDSPLQVQTIEMEDGTTREEFVISQAQAFESEPRQLPSGAQLHAPAAPGGLALVQDGAVLIIAQGETMALQVQQTEPTESWGADTQAVHQLIASDAGRSQGYAAFDVMGLRNVLSRLDWLPEGETAPINQVLSEQYTVGVLARKFFADGIYWDLQLR